MTYSSFVAGDSYLPYEAPYKCSSFCKFIVIKEMLQIIDIFPHKFGVWMSVTHDLEEKAKLKKVKIYRWT